MSRSSSAVSFSESAFARTASASPLPSRSARAPMRGRLRPQIPDLEHERLIARQAVADRREKIVLGLQIRGRGISRGMRPDLELLLGNATAHRQPRRVGSGRDLRRGLRPLVEDRLRREDRLEDPHVPDHAIDAGLRGQRLVLVALLELFERAPVLQIALGRLLFLARKRPQPRVAVEDLEPHDFARLRLLLQPVREDDALGHVLSDRTRRRVLVRLLDLRADGRTRREEVGGLAGDLGLPEPQRRQVVEDPERAPLRGDDEVAVLDRKVRDRRDRQVALERLPARAVVEGDVEPGLRAGVEQTSTDRILPHDAREGLVGDAGDDLRPRLAEVGRLVEVRTEVVQLVHRRRDVRGGLVARRGLDRVDLNPVGNALRRHVLPRLAAVLRDVDEAVVAPDPEDAGVERRLGDREDRVVHLDAGHVLL